MTETYCVCDGYPTSTLAVAGLDTWGKIIYRGNTRERAEDVARKTVAAMDRGVTVVVKLSGGGYARVSQWHGNLLTVQTWRALKDKYEDSPIPWNKLTRTWCDWAHDALRTVDHRGMGVVDVEMLAYMGDLEGLEAAVVPRFEVLR